MQFVRKTGLSPDKSERLVRKYPPFSGQNVLVFSYRSDIRVTMAQRKIPLDPHLIVRPRHKAGST